MTFAITSRGGTAATKQNKQICISIEILIQDIYSVQSAQFTSVPASFLVPIVQTTLV